MSISYYSHFAFIEPQVDVSLSVLKTNLEKFYGQSSADPIPTITVEGNELLVSFEAYTFFVHLVDEPYVLEEALEFAEDDTNAKDWLEHPVDLEKLKTCNRRFEVWGEDDEDMDYFNDSLYIMEAIDAFEGTTIYYLS